VELSREEYILTARSSQIRGALAWGGQPVERLSFQGWQLEQFTNKHQNARQIIRTDKIS
jgi:hypothetical protein